MSHQFVLTCPKVLADLPKLARWMLVLKRCLVFGLWYEMNIIFLTSNEFTRILCVKQRNLNKKIDRTIIKTLQEHAWFKGSTPSYCWSHSHSAAPLRWETHKGTGAQAADAKTAAAQTLRDSRGAERAKHTSDMDQRLPSKVLSMSTTSLRKWRPPIIRWYKVFRGALYYFPPQDSQQV